MRIIDQSGLLTILIPRHNKYSRTRILATMITRADTCLMELQFLPCIQYMSKFILYDKVVLERCENYQKRSYRNRTHIISANGIERLSVPLASGKNEQQPITEVRIAYDEPWVVQLRHTLQNAYGRAPYYEHYIHDLIPIFEQQPPLLWDLNTRLLSWILKIIGVSDPELSQDYVRNTSDNVADLRQAIHPKSPMPDPHFEQVQYYQVFEDRHGFVPNLSVLDLIFAHGPETLSTLKRCIT